MKTNWLIFDTFAALGFSGADSFRLCDADISRLKFVNFGINGAV